MPERVVVAHPMSDGLVAPKRWEEFTGRQAERIAGTETTPAVAAGVGVAGE